MSKGGPCTGVVTVVNPGSNSSKILILYSNEKPPNPKGSVAPGHWEEANEHMLLYQYAQHFQPGPSL
jgi:hypothetical protein